MSDIEAYLWVAAGVFFSAIAPIAIRWIGKYKLKTASVAESFKNFSLPYIQLAICSLVIGVITLAVVKNSGGGKFNQWYQPFLIGYFFDSTIQKVKDGLT